MGTTPCFSVFFIKGNNFCVFLFASWDVQALSIWGLLIKARMEDCYDLFCKAVNIIIVNGRLQKLMLIYWILYHENYQVSIVPIYIAV